MIRFNYWEKNINTPNDSTMLHVDWNLGSYTAVSIQGNEEMTTSYSGNAFFSFLKDNIPHYTNDNDIYVRHKGNPNVEFIFTVAADEFYTYMEVNKPASGIVTEKPEYTNISNGIGIFSSRFEKSVPLDMHPISLDSLYNGHFTMNLGFDND